MVRTRFLSFLTFATFPSVGCIAHREPAATATVVTAFRAPQSSTGTFMFRTQNWTPRSDVFEVQNGQQLTELDGVEIQCLDARCVSESKQQVRFLPSADGTLPTQVDLQFQKPGFKTLKVTAPLRSGNLPFVVILEPEAAP